MHAPDYLFIYPNLWRFRSAAGGAPPDIAHLSWLKTLGVLKIGSPEVSLHAVFTARQGCRASIPHGHPASILRITNPGVLSGLDRPHSPIIQVALEVVGVFQMSESKRAQIVEQSIVLLDRVLSNSSGQGVFDDQRRSIGTDHVGSGLNAHVERLLLNDLRVCLPHRNIAEGSSRTTAAKAISRLTPSPAPG
jgi:hypothetical protein